MKILEEEGAVLALVPCGENPTNQKTKRKTKLPQSIIVPKDVQHCKPDTLKTAFRIKHAHGTRWFQIKPKPGHTTKTWVWDYRREEMDADSPFHSTQRVTRGVSGKFGRHGKIILMLDEYFKWQDGWTNWHAFFTISKKKGQPVFGEVTSNSLCTSKVHTQSVIDVSQYIITQTKTEPDHLSIQKLLSRNFRTALSPSQTKD